jgi:hypothetical protein
MILSNKRLTKQEISGRRWIIPIIIGRVNGSNPLFSTLLEMGDV